MKKLNLLLATTAMLSVGAATTKAATISGNELDLGVKVALYKAATITSASDVNFGAFLIPENNQEFTITFSEHNTNQVVVPEGITQLLNVGYSTSAGSIIVAHGPSISCGWNNVSCPTNTAIIEGLPNSVSLTSDENEIVYTPEIMSIGYGSDGDYYSIGGSIKVPANAKAGKYEGHLTMTFVVAN